LILKTDSVSDTPARLFSFIESKIFQQFVFELLFVTVLCMISLRGLSNKVSK
jgi:hypothetical protein